MRCKLNPLKLSDGMFGAAPRGSTQVQQFNVFSASSNLENFSHHKPEHALYSNLLDSSGICKLLQTQGLTLLVSDSGLCKCPCLRLYKQASRGNSANVKQTQVDLAPKDDLFSDNETQRW